jgi:hypothetical protein
MAKRFAPEYPGEVLGGKELFRKDRGRPAKKSGPHPRHVSQIIHALNQKARYDLAGREGKARRTS